MSEAGDVKSTGREDAKEQLANAGGPVVGISWHRSVSCSLWLFVGNCNCLGKTTSVQTLSFSLSTVSVCFPLPEYSPPYSTAKLREWALASCSTIRRTRLAYLPIYRPQATDRREADGIHSPTIPVPYLYMR